MRMVFFTLIFIKSLDLYKLYKGMKLPSSVFEVGIENYLLLIFRKINDFVHNFILVHKSVDFTILVVNFTILNC
jgi:dimeric dUTPase (all-alpha-NTP-PPase superfamily)